MFENKKQLLNKNYQNLKRFYLLQVRLGDRGRRVESEGGRAPKKVGPPFEWQIIIVCMICI